MKKLDKQTRQLKKSIDKKMNAALKKVPKKNRAMVKKYAPIAAGVVFAGIALLSLVAKAKRRNRD
jgi:hypothetical protein